MFSALQRCDSVSGSLDWKQDRIASQMKMYRGEMFLLSVKDIKMKILENEKFCWIFFKLFSNNGLILV